MMFVWIIIIGVLLYWLFGNELGFQKLSKNRPLDVLNNRLARGEISMEEYREVKDLIQKN